MEWNKVDKAIIGEVFVIIKVREQEGRKEYTDLGVELGGWHDLVFMLWSSFKQFRDETDECRSRKDKHNKLDEIADRLAAAERPYEFKLPDGTDEWYQAYSKRIQFRLDHNGELR